MAGTERIKIPWKHRWRRFRYSVLPFISFVLCALLAAMLWEHQGRMANAVGEVEAVRLEIASGAAGTLVPLPQGNWTLFDAVQNDQVIARLDGTATRAALEVLRADLVRLRGELSAAEAQHLQDLEGIRIDHHREVRELVFEVERRRLDFLDRKTQIEIDRMERQRLDTNLEFLRPLHEEGHVSEMEFADTKLLRDAVARRIEENTAALLKAETQLQLAEDRMTEFGPPEVAEITTLLAPLQAAVATQEARIRELELLVQSLEIRSPITGTICGIYAWPRQNIQANDPILTIAADHGRYIVSYVRQGQGFRPVVGMPVGVKTRVRGSRLVAARIERVGPQFEPVPSSQLLNPNAPEWGLPVRIALPNDFNAKPGELIDVTFGARTDKDAG